MATGFSDMATQRVASRERLVAGWAGERGAPQMDGGDVLADVVVIHLHAASGASTRPLTDDSRASIPGIAIYVGFLQVVRDCGDGQRVELRAAEAAPATRRP